MSQKILLLGATGHTGSHILRQALDDGIWVRAFVRHPEKIPADLRDHPGLEIVEGDFKDTHAVRKAVKGCSSIICAAGDAKTQRKEHIMSDLMHEVVDGMREHNVHRLVYQAGAFSPAPGQDNPRMIKWFSRPVLGRLMGIHGMLEDNDEVITFLHDQASDIDWTVTRPGTLREKKPNGDVHASTSPGGTVSFEDAARFDLNLALSRKHNHQAPYVACS